MGHDGMLYSLPSRELIADSVEYMCNAHKADAMICISNCDKITPGMLMAAMRLNIPAIFVSGGPMEAGIVGDKRYDLIDAMVMAADRTVGDAEIERVERCACPTCGSCSGMFTANSMNCLNEALGLALPGNGTMLATHTSRTRLFEKAAARIVEMADAWYEPRRQLGPAALHRHQKRLHERHGPGYRHGRLDQHRPASPGHRPRGGRRFHHGRHRRLSRQVPNLCKVAPSSTIIWRMSTGPAASWPFSANWTGPA